MDQIKKVLQIARRSIRRIPGCGVLGRRHLRLVPDQGGWAIEARGGSGEWNCRGCRPAVHLEQGGWWPSDEQDVRRDGMLARVQATLEDACRTVYGR